MNELVSGGNRSRHHHPLLSCWVRVFAHVRIQGASDLPRYTDGGRHRKVGETAQLLLEQI